MLDTIRHGDEKYLPFALERRIVPKVILYNESTLPHKTVLRDGSLTIHKYNIVKVEYSFLNKSDDHIKNFYVEHPRKANVELINCDPPLAKTKNFYRFLIDIKPKTLTKFLVTERTPSNDFVPVFEASATTLATYKKYKYYDETMYHTLAQEIFPRKEKLSHISVEASSLGNRITTKQQEIDRILQVDLVQNEILAASTNQVSPITQSFTQLARLHKEKTQMIQHYLQSRQEWTQLDESLQRWREQLTGEWVIFEPPARVLISKHK